MPVEIVQNFVEENEHHPAGRLEEFADRFGSRRRRPGSRRAQARNSRVSSGSVRHIDPRRFFAVLLVPRVADKDTDFCFGYFCKARFPHQVRDTGKRARLFAVFGKMIEAGKSVGFAATKLRDER